MLYYVDMYFSILTSDGQGIAIRLSKQVSRVNKQIRKHLSDYNDLMKIGDQSGADVALMFEDVIQEKWLLETFPMSNIDRNICINKHY